MSTSRKELVEVLYQLLESTSDSRQLARQVAAHLVTERRTKDIGAVLRELESLRHDRGGVLEIHATSAHPLNSASKDAIKALFPAKKVIVHEQQDPSLLGGVKVRAHDKQIDFSVRTRLQRLKAGAK